MKFTEVNPRNEVLVVEKRWVGQAENKSFRIIQYNHIF